MRPVEWDSSKRGHVSGTDLGLRASTHPGQVPDAGDLFPDTVLDTQLAVLHLLLQLLNAVPRPDSLLLWETEEQSGMHIHYS